MCEEMQQVLFEAETSLAAKLPHFLLTHVNNCWHSGRKKYMTLTCVLNLGY